MKLKSYFSRSVEAAMELAQKELGEEALLVHARPATPETRYLGAYEVVFGVGPGLLPPPAPLPMRDELAELRQQVERLSRTIEPPAILPSVRPSRSDRARELMLALTEEELDPALAEQVAAGAPLAELFSVDSQLGRPGAARAVIALVGPPGAGKTTTLIKLAARYGLAARRRVQILSADTQRIAAADQLRTMASILGIGCDVAETPQALPQMLLEYHGKQLILIDTPGFSFREIEDARELADLLASNPEIDTHLVLPASLKPADLRRTATHFEMFQPSKLLFTRLDETSRFGALVSESARMQRPISFLATGQEIPGDLDEASADRLVELVLGSDVRTAPALRRMEAAA